MTNLSIRRCAICRPGHSSRVGHLGLSRGGFRTGQTLELFLEVLQISQVQTMIGIIRNQGALDV